MFSLWSNRRVSNKHNQRAKKASHFLAQRRLQVEPLERRDLLSGVVNIAVGAGGTLTLTGDAKDNSVEMRQDTGANGGPAGFYQITRPANDTTQFTLGGDPTLLTLVTVNPI